MMVQRSIEINHLLIRGIISHGRAWVKSTGGLKHERMWPFYLWTNHRELRGLKDLEFEPLYTVLGCLNIKIDQQSGIYPRGFHIGEQLCFLNTLNLFNGLKFNNAPVYK